jgi:peptidoglycan/xylan/chitin deacetylase (PgdA/CDA1 family)
MYHSISECKENEVHPYYRINTSPDIFAEHMRFLYDNNYSVTSLQDIKRYFELEEKIKNKYVIITFDDGYHNFYTKAFPILQNYGFNSTVFLPTEFIENKRLKSKEKQTLIWKEREY